MTVPPQIAEADLLDRIHVMGFAASTSRFAVSARALRLLSHEGRARQRQSRIGGLRNRPKPRNSPGISRHSRPSNGKRGRRYGALPRASRGIRRRDGSPAVRTRPKNRQATRCGNDRPACTVGFNFLAVPRRYLSAMKGTGQIWWNTANGIARVQSSAT
jgi:hypothetical protein